MTEMEEVSGILSYFNNNLGMLIITAILLLDTIRAVIAMMGWVNPNAKYAWIVYGRFKSSLIAAGLKELGFEPQKGEELEKRTRKLVKQAQDSFGITKENAAERLICLITKYIVFFDKPIQYGNKTPTESSFYIDTMEMAHNAEDLRDMTSIMTFLYATQKKPKKPEVIVTPKGGNPLFAQSVASFYGATYVVGKSESDKSRITSVEKDKSIDFLYNYEGAWSVAYNKKGKEPIIVDCNASGGSQLLKIIQDLKEISDAFPDSGIGHPREAYVLFKADVDKVSRGDNIDEAFKDNNCTLYRFFDLDEEVKQKIYNLKVSVGEGHTPSLYNDDDKKQINEIINDIKAKKHFYYGQQVNTEDGKTLETTIISAESTPLAKLEEKKE